MTSRDDVSDRILAWVEIAAYGLVALTLAVGGLVLLVDTVVKFFQHLDNGVPAAATDMLSTLLLARDREIQSSD